MAYLASDTLPYLITLLGTGFILGLRHAFDADHLAAVSTVVSQTRSVRASLRYGIIWGTGHTFTLLLTGLLVLGFRLSIPDPVAAVFEALVGLMLVLLGLNLFRTESFSNTARYQEPDAASAGTFRQTLRSAGLRSFIIGAVHGLAGSAALMLLIVSTVTSVYWGTLYILTFGLGSILGMLVFSGILALPLAVTSDNHRLQRSIKILAGIASILLGAMILYEFFAVQVH